MYNLKWIENKGATQYINTGFKPNQDTRIVMQVSNPGTNAYFFNAWSNDWNKNNYSCVNDYAHSNGNIFIAYGNQTGGTKVLSGDIIIDYNKNIIKVNGEEIVAFDYTDFQSLYDLTLFAQNRKGTIHYSPNDGAFRLHQCQIYDNETLVRDFIPVLDEYSVACLYDKVSDTYFYNQGSGLFRYYSDFFTIDRTTVEGFAAQARRLGGVEGKLSTAKMKKIFEGVTDRSSFNIAYGDIAPVDTSALWIKTDEPIGVSSIVNFDGTATFEENVGNLATAVDLSDVAVAVGYKIYVFGGFNGNGTIGDIQCYDTLTGQTTVVGNLINPTNGCAVARVGNKVYVFGGRSGTTGNVIGNIECFDTDDNSITLLDATITPRQFFSAVTVGEKIYIIGGNMDPVSSLPIEIFDTVTNTVETLQLNYNYGQACRARAIGKYIYIAAGWNCSNTTFGGIDRFDTTNNELHSCNWLLYNAQYRGFATVGSMMCSIGGSGYSGNKTKYAQIVNLFTRESNTIYNYPEGVWSVATAVIGNCIYLLGGNLVTSGVISNIHRIKINRKLPYKHLLIEVSDDAYTAGLGVNVKNVYIGNENDEAEYVETFLYRDGKWQHI